jgi:hypothetical protein
MIYLVSEMGRHNRSHLGLFIRSLHIRYIWFVHNTRTAAIPC